MSDDVKLASSLKAVTDAVAQGREEVDACALALKACESRVNEQIATLVKHVARVVFEANSQVLRQRAIRALYWGSRIKASMIAEAFGLNEHGIHSIAGPLIDATPCEGGCGRQVERMFRSHSDWRALRPRSKHRISDLCPECKAHHDALGRVEYEKYLAEQQAEAAAYCAENGHHWGAEDINGRRAENGVDWISNNRPIRLVNAMIAGIDSNEIVLEVFCMNQCGASMEKRISAASN